MGRRICGGLFLTESSDPAYWPTDLSEEGREQLIAFRFLDLAFKLDEW